MQPLDIFEVLVREHAAMLTSYLRASVNDTATADDLWQETMVTAWKRWDDYDRSRPFGAWLRGIARNNILAWHRKQARSGVTLDTQALDYVDSVFQRIGQQNGDTFHLKLAALRSCIDALPGQYRDVVEMRYQQEMPPAAIAEERRQKLDTIKKQLQRARGLLLDCVTRKLNIPAPQS